MNTKNTIQENISRGFSVIKDNPHVLYTIFLLIIVPLAFVASGQRFLDAASSNQERIEKERIGLMQDTFVEFAKTRIDDPLFLQARVESLALQNPTVKAFRISKINGNEFQVIASLNQNEIDGIDQESKTAYESIGIPTGSSALVETTVGGVRHWKAFRIIPDREGAIQGILVSDISMEHIDLLNEKAINRAYLYLSFIIAAMFILLIAHARMIDYVRLYRRIKEADKMKDDFISIASHELRAPLTAISWQADLLESSEKNAQGIESIRSAAKQLGQLVEDMLDVSRIEQGRMKIDLKMTDISNVVQAVIDLVRPNVEGKGLALHYEKHDLPSINVDPARLSQVLTNLINNATKYTKKGEIRIDTAEERESLIIRVRDTGIGIVAADQKRLFSKFSRIKNDETRGIRGTGLGLWITKQIVETMNGTISVESIKDVGSSFTVTFPLPVKNG